jgi:hypothetical protein
VIENFGVQGVQVEELYDLDPSAFEPLHPVYGLVFLFKYRQVRGPCCRAGYFSFVEPWDGDSLPPPPPTHKRKKKTRRGTRGP